MERAHLPSSVDSPVAFPSPGEAPKQEQQRREAPFLAFDGDPVLEAALLDSTERAQTEERFRLLIENGSDIIAVINLDGRLQYASPSMERILGYRREARIGRPSDELLHPDDAPVLRAIYAALQDRPEESHRFEFRFRHADGSWRILEGILRTLVEGDVVTGIIINAREITQRVEAEQTLRLQKTLLEAQGEASIDGILVVADDGTIRSFNQRFIEMWHLSPEIVDARSDEVALQAVLDQLHDPKAFLARIESLYRNPDEKARDEIVLRDGRVFDRYSAPVISGQGDYYGRIWFFRDITTQKRHAQELEQARQEAEHAREQASAYARSLELSLDKLQTAQARLVQQEKLASLGQLTAGIAHEIKNPLNFVNNFAVLIRELVEELRQALAAGETDLEDLLADLKQNAEKIEKHGSRADAIVKSMMLHARPGTGQRQATDLNALVAEYVHLAVHGKRAERPGVDVAIERDLGQDVGTVEVIPSEMGRVLVNLLDNAFDAVYERAGRDLGPYAPVIKISTRCLGDRAEIRLADNGPGIAPALRDRLFEPFFTTKPAGRGTGLGLSLSYDIVTQGHGGTLAVESTEGEGATCVITIPYQVAS